jgi:cytochrome P450
MVGILHIVNQHPLRLTALATLWPWLPVPSNRRFVRVKSRLDAIVDGLVARHGRGSEGGDIVDRLLAARDPETGEGMSAAQIRDEIITLMLAGHETSATGLTWTFHLLARHPEIEERLCAELAHVLGGRPAMTADLPRLPYLKQVVQESMRLYPPVWGIARKCTEETEFGAYRVPRNAYIAITMYVLHRHPQYWPDPERFDPERFDPKRSESRHSYCYLPFSAGPRACIGAGMAMLEIQLVLAQLLQRFRVRPLPDHPVVPQAVVTLKPRFGLPATLAPR